jgi:hypothetical protein
VSFETCIDSSESTVWLLVACSVVGFREAQLFQITITTTTVQQAEY